MIRHIEFCLEEIECEIEAQDSSGLSDTGRLSLQRHIAQMRAVLADWRAESRHAGQAGQAGQAAAIGDVPPGDKLIWIRGVDADTASRLAAKGITSFQTIAAWRQADIAVLADETLSLERIAEQNWIEQAAILATGQLTLHAKQIELASIANVEVVAAAIIETAVDAEPAPILPVAATPADAQPAPTIAAQPAQPVIDIASRPHPITAEAITAEAIAVETTVVDLASARRTGIGRRIAQVAAAALVIVAASVGTLNGWDVAKFTAITAALAEHVQSR